MKIKNLWMVTLFLIALFIIPNALLQAEAQIKNITLQREGDYTNVAILAETPFQFNHFIEEKKDGKPYRIVIDCVDAIHSLPQNNFRGLPSGMISAIRTSQYQISPKKICRVVLDLKEPVVYKVVGEGNSKIAKLALSTPKDSAYPLWSAVGEKETRESATLAETKPVEKTLPIKKSKDEIVVSKDKPKKDLAVSTKKEIQKSDIKTAQKIESSEKSVTQVKKEVAKSLPVKESEKNTGTAIKEKKQLELAQKPVESSSEKKEVKTEEKSKLQAEKKKPEPTSTPQPAEAKKPEKQKEAAVEKKTGKKMEEVPKRKILVYHSGKRQDPFSPLTGKKNFTLGSVPLPSIDELKLVGVLEDNNGFKALLENELGFGYIMQPGDKIKNGAVVSVNKERIIFQIWEYGFTKNIALELFTPNQEER